MPQRVGWLEVNLDVLLALPHGVKMFAAFSRYPTSDVDLAFEVEESVPAAAVATALREAAGDLLVDLALFDVFRSESMGEGKRSLAYTLRFQADDRTLTDGEIAETRQRCIDVVQGALPAVLRS